MFISYKLLIKFFITILTSCLGSYFFYIGYLPLHSYKLNNFNPINSKNNIDFGKNDYLSRSDDLEIFYESKKNQIIFENEILIEIKKNDTFNKVIDPYFQNNTIKNKIINKLNKEYNLKNLKIGQEIYFYQDTEKITKKIIIPIDFSTDIIIEVLKT